VTGDLRDRPTCNWPRCRGPQTGKCFAWCNCRCHAWAVEQARAARVTGDLRDRPSEELRRAAATLRGAVNKCTTDEARWDEAFPSMQVYGDGSTYERLIVHPAVGLALADWLDATARTGELVDAALTDCGDPHLNWEYGDMGKALTVARAVNGADQ
jgi:hypothetical protein